MKKKIFLALCLLLLTPVVSYGADTIEGTIQGFNCVMEGKTCLLGAEDPLVATENTFVLLTTDGKKFYFVPNVDRAVMARHVAEPVKITGNVKNNIIRARTIEAYKNGKWKIVFTTPGPYGQ